MFWLAGDRYSTPLCWFLPAVFREPPICGSKGEMRFLVLLVLLFGEGAFAANPMRIIRLHDLLYGPESDVDFVVMEPGAECQITWGEIPYFSVVVNNPRGLNLQIYDVGLTFFTGPIPPMLCQPLFTGSSQESCEWIRLGIPEGVFQWVISGGVPYQTEQGCFITTVGEE